MKNAPPRPEHLKKNSGNQSFLTEKVYLALIFSIADGLLKNFEEPTLISLYILSMSCYSKQE